MCAAAERARRVWVVPGASVLGIDGLEVMVVVVFRRFVMGGGGWERMCALSVCLRWWRAETFGGLLA